MHIVNESLKEVSNYKESHCLIAVCLYQKYLNEAYLDAVIDFVNHNFKRCSVILCDSVYRHTRLIDSPGSIEDAYRFSREEGNFWLKNNLKILERLTIESDLSLWEQWVFDSANYKKQEKLVNNLYDNDINFQACINLEIEEYIERHFKSKNLSLENEDLYEWAKKCSTDYYIEECAGLLSIWRNLRMQYILYPAVIPAPFAYIFKKFVNIRDPNALQWLHIDFKKIKLYELKNKIEVDSISHHLIT